MYKCMYLYKTLGYKSTADLHEALQVLCIFPCRDDITGGIPTDTMSGDQINIQQSVQLVGWNSNANLDCLDKHLRNMEKILVIAKDISSFGNHILHTSA